MKIFIDTANLGSVHNRVKVRDPHIRILVRHKAATIMTADGVSHLPFSTRVKYYN